jgi:hypothetical protein
VVVAFRGVVAFLAVAVLVVAALAAGVLAAGVLAAGVLAAAGAFAAAALAVEVRLARGFGSAAGTTAMPGSSATGVVTSASGAFRAVDALRRAGAFFAGCSAGAAAAAAVSAPGRAGVVEGSGAGAPAGLEAGSDGGGVLAWLTWTTLATNPAIVKPAVEPWDGVAVPLSRPRGAVRHAGGRMGGGAALRRRGTGSLTA